MFAGRCENSVPLLLLYIISLLTNTLKRKFKNFRKKVLHTIVVLLIYVS